MRHPEAQDTVEGITDWWLLEERIRFVSAEVSRALADLSGRGFVLARRQRDGRVVFRLNSDRAAEIREWLESPREPRAPGGTPSRRRR